MRLLTFQIDESPTETLNRSASQNAMHSGLRWSYQFLVFLAAFVTIIFRRPDAIFNAQFYAEDGRLWFADAYNHGAWTAFFHTYQGYLHLIPRLAGAAALLVPIQRAPLVENLIALAIQALPVCLLLSSRSRGWGSLKFRCVLAFLYLMLPNTREMMATVTESQWILALCALLVLVGEAPGSRTARVFDLFALALCSLTGPFCIFLSPFALFLLWHRRKEPHLQVASAIIFLGSIIQSVLLLTNESTRHRPELGASIEWLVRILSGNVYLGTLFGWNTLSSFLPLSMLVCIAIAGSAILVLGAFVSGIEMRCLLLFAAALFAASLADPVVYPPSGTTAWEFLTKAHIHYWFFPCLAFAWALAGCVRSDSRILRIVSASLLALMIIGIVRDYRYPAFRDLHFASYAKQLYAAPSKSDIAIPENPNGWDLEISKH